MRDQQNPHVLLRDDRQEPEVLQDSLLWDMVEFKTSDQNHQGEMEMATEAILNEDKVYCVETPNILEVACLVNEEDTYCGLWSWHPRWLQRFASKKMFVVIHGLIGFIMFANGAYLAATLGTMGKRFKVPNKISGLIYSSFHLGFLLVLFPLAYLGGRHKPRFVAVGTLLAGLMCLLMATPHAMYGSGQDALDLTWDYGVNPTIHHNDSAGDSGGVSTCGQTATSDEDCTPGSESTTPTVILYLAHLVMGVGSSTYFTLGTTYLDDNTSKNKAPLVLAISSCIVLLGPTFGYATASYMLSLYVNPTLNPVIDAEDPRWIGAWWLGWIPFSMITCILGVVVAFFPKYLPRAATRKGEQRVRLQQANTSFKDFKQAFRRMITNKLLVFNTFSAVFFVFGATGYLTFMPKYLEAQYGQSAAMASLISGSVGLVFTALGIMASALVIYKFKPSPRSLAAWSVFMELLDVAAHVMWSFLSCPSTNLQGSWTSDHSWNLTDICNVDCNCGPNDKYSPICSLDGSSTYYSPCHAGCTTSNFINGTTMFGDCSCISGGQAVDGACSVDCTTSFTVFLVTQCAMRFLEATGRAGNTLLGFRCVEERDKPLSYAFTESLLSTLALIPGPIVYGTLLDSTCIVWGQTCGENGNCWMYDAQKLSGFMNYLAAVCLFCGTVLDSIVWFYAKDIQVYDEATPPQAETKNK